MRSLILTTLFLALPAVLEASQDAAVSSQSYTGPIIDMHLHSYTDGELGRGTPNPVTGQPSPGSAEEHMVRSIEVMRQYNVVLGVVDGAGLASTAAWHDRAPQMVLRGLMFEDPTRLMTPAALGELIEGGEVEVLGEVGAQYAGYSPSDPAFSEYWTLAEERGVPVGIHTGQSFPGTPYRGRPDFRLRYGDPLLLEDMLVRHPDLKVYMMHAGGGGPFSQNALMMMAMYPQLHVDLGVLSWLPGMDTWLVPFLEQAKEGRMLDRVMFGSDQMVWPEAIGMAVERINGYDFLTVDEKSDIFYNNAARFLGLSEEVIARHQENVRQNPPSAGTQDTLRDVISELDTRYFEAYNRCDLEALDALHADDLEAYHDIGGGPVDWESMREILAQGLCSVPGRVRRDLVPGTLAVYPIAGVGALQLADHLFYERGEDGEERLTTAAKMVVLWRHTDDGWKVSRLISYDHGPPPNGPQEDE